MDTMEFRVKPHETLPDNQMVEVWRGGVFVAGIYPHEDGLKLVSKYWDGVEHDPGYPPCVIMHLTKE